MSVWAGQDVIAEHTGALVDIARSAPLATPVATCGDWSLADLTWHLAEVQQFWAWIIAHRPSDPAGYTEPDRPPDDELAGRLRISCDALLDGLRDADPADPAWSWSDDHTVGFTVRRQSHEALIHRVDAGFAVGATLPLVDERVAADGVDEIVDLFLTGVPSWATFEPAGGSVRLAIKDTDRTWTLGLGRMTGTSPDTGTTYDLGAMELLEEPTSQPAAIVSAGAFALDLWLWGRLSDDAVSIVGDHERVAAARAIIVEATQ